MDSGLVGQLGSSGMVQLFGQGDHLHIENYFSQQWVNLLYFMLQVRLLYWRQES
jgi:hypothetical protein